MEYPDQLFYSADHEWLRVDGAEASIGITAFAGDQLGDIVYLDIPVLGKLIRKGEVFGTIEAVKTVSDLFMSASGTITQINPLLADQPELVNSDPYGEGWLIRVSLTDGSELRSLMDAEQYQKLLV